MNNDFLTAYTVLNEVFRKDAYVNLALNAAGANDSVRRMVYGVVEKNIELDWILAQLSASRPKPAVSVALKLGTYCLRYMDSLKNYTVIDQTVEALKQCGKAAVAPFVNAVLRKVSEGAYTLPSSSDKNYLSVTFNRPQWFVDLVDREYSPEERDTILRSEVSRKVHFRVNPRLTTEEKVMKVLSETGAQPTATNVGGFLADMSVPLRDMFSAGFVTYQGASSMFAVQAASICKTDLVLDACSAPGGKTIYASELAADGTVVACDVHEHRLELIRGYARRMRAENVSVRAQDATAYFPEFDGKFDVVLVDAPCSGLGTAAAKPDVLLKKTPSDLVALSEIQLSALKNCSRYVKNGGVLVYSTCSLAHCENGGVVDAFLAENKNFRLDRIPNADDNDGTVQLLPQNEYEGFYVARMVKNG